MKPQVLLIEPMMPEVEAQLDAAYWPAAGRIASKASSGTTRNSMRGSYFVIPARA